MRTVQEYLENARQCRELAAKLENPGHKFTLEEMAETWARLAAEQQAQLGKEARER